MLLLLLLVADVWCGGGGVGCSGYDVSLSAAASFFVLLLLLLITDCTIEVAFIVLP